MKPTAVSADVLFEDFRQKLEWHWVASKGATERHFDEVAVRMARSGADLVGYLNYIHPMFVTHESAAFVIDLLRAYLSKHFADRTTLHGVMMDILGMGVMITGESGLGKSELGLELISRGHGLVADDAVDLYRINQTTLEGRCPVLLQNLLEVRGIGLLDIQAIFGETAVRRKMRLKLIVHLVRKETLERDYDRLPHEPLTEHVLGIPVRKVVIQVVAGRNIAVLVEAAVRNTILQMRGIDTYEKFVSRHREAMQSDRMD